MKFTICYLLVFSLLIFQSIHSFSQATWYKYPGNPVIVLGEKDEPGFSLITKAIIFEDSLYRMWFSNIMDREFPITLQYATSRDGIQWDVCDPTPVKFEFEDKPWGKWIGYFDILKTDTSYYLWYNTESKTNEFVIAIAISDDGLNWKVLPETALQPGKENEWDHRGPGAPHVEYDGSQYYMFYTAADKKRPVRQMMGLATSDDGIHWNKYPANPVFTPGDPGSWDDHEVVTFSVSYDGSIFEQWYNGSDLDQFNIGYASSLDGINWIRGPSNPVLRSGVLGSWEGAYPFGATVIKQDTIYKAWYQGTNMLLDGLGYATTSYKETLEWKDAGIDKPKRNISVNVFNRFEIIPIDSLEELLTELSGHELIDTYNKLSLAYSLNDDEKSFWFADKALEMAERERYPEGKAMALYSKSNCQYVMDNYADALVNQLAALRLFDSLGNIAEKANILSQLASIQAYTGSYDLALRFYKEALGLFERMNDTSSILQSLNYLGYTYLKVFDTLNAINTFYQGLKITRASGLIWDQYLLHEELGTCFTGRNIDSATYHFNRSELRWAENIKGIQELVNFGKLYLYIADAYYSAGPDYYEKAEEYFLKCYDYQILGSNTTIVRLLYTMAEFYMTTGRYKLAMESLDGSFYLCSKYLRSLSHRLYSSLNMKLEDEIFLKSYMEKIHRLYSSLYSAKMDNDLAFHHYKLATQWKDSIYNQQNQRQWAMLQGQYETERAENRISVLESENEVKDLRIRQTKIFLFGIGGFAVLIILMALLLIRQNKTRSEHKSIVLEQKLLRVQMNPHFIFNSLGDLQGFIWKKDQLKANEYLSSFSKLLRLILDNSRQEFVPVEKEIGAIEHYLKIQSLSYQDKFEYTIDIDDEIDEEAMLIPPMLTQPFIENSIEHGILQKDSMGHINVCFSLDQGQELIHIEVVDDGIGFKNSSMLKKSKQAGHESLAMKITQERLMMVSKKFRQKIVFNIADVMDENNNVTGARVAFAVPFSRI